MGIFPFFYRHRPWGLTLCVAIIAMVMGGCYFQEKAMTPTASLEMGPVIDHAFEENTFIAASWIDENWWELFQDQQLTTLIEQAFEKSPSLLIAQERVYMAHEGARQTFAPLLPSVDLDFQELLAGFSWHDRKVGPSVPQLPNEVIPKWINFLSFFLNFKWRLDLFGKQRNLYKAAVSEVSMQAAEACQCRLLLSTQIAQAYFNWQQSLAIQNIQELLLEDHQKLLALFEGQMSQGLVDDRTVLEQQKQILNQTKELAVTSEQIALSISQLQTLLGLSAGAPLSLQAPETSFGFVFPFPKKVPLNFLMRRADVVAKIWKVKACSKRVKSAQVAFMPSIDLGSFSGYLDLKWENLVEPRGWFSSILPGLSLPIFKGLQLRSQLNYNVRRYNLSVYDYNQTLLKAAQEVVDSILTFRVSSQKIADQEEIMQKNRDLTELAKQRYEVGLNSLHEVLKTHLSCLQDELQLQELGKMHRLSALSLIKSLGGGYVNPEAEDALEELEHHD